jgi:ankyrin repeat protein
MHKSCATQWFTIKSSCPMCRTKINPSDHGIHIINNNNNINPIDRQNIHGFTALMTAAKNGHIEIVKVLLQHGANPNITDNSNKTAYMYALDTNNSELINLLI